MDKETVTAAVVGVPVILAAVSQLAAIFGKPKIVAAIRPLSMLFDLLAGNYRKAKNKGAPSAAEK